jgi:AraC-like DNA-binding protein
LLPALHVLGIGSIALALAVLVARRSLDAILGHPALPATPAASSLAQQAALPPDNPAPRAASPALTRLTQAMTEDHVYRREGLSLAALAQTLNLGEAALRGLINQELGYRNFNDFLHHYRLQEAAARLTGEDLPILSIALECGYGSIGPFNRAFRQRFGMTPTEYRAAARMERLRGTTGASLGDESARVRDESARPPAPCRPRWLDFKPSEASCTICKFHRCFSWRRPS